MADETTPPPVPDLSVPIQVELAAIAPGVVQTATDMGMAGTVMPAHRPAVQSQTMDPSVPATTTFQQDLTKAGQRHINVMWERTQQVIAILVSTVAMSVSGYLVVSPSAGVTPELRLLAFTLISNMLVLVLSTYYQRTNHNKVGGVGDTDTGR